MKTVVFGLLLLPYLALASHEIHVINKYTLPLCEPHKSVVYQINFLDQDSPTEVEMKYTLQKTSEREYVIGINPFFPINHEEELASLNECFSLFNPVLFDKNSPQTRLTFKLDKRAPQVKIAVKGVPFFSRNYHHSNSHEWANGESCAVKMHEIKHRIGIVDEGEDNKFSNQRIVFEDSFMGNNFEDIAARSLGGYQFSYCNTPPAGKPSRLNGWTCSAKNMVSNQLLYSERKLSPGQYIHFPYTPHEEYQSTHSFSIVDKFIKGTEGGILAKRMIDAIIYPNCPEVNADYYEQAKLAYIKQENLEDARFSEQEAEHDLWLLSTFGTIHEPKSQTLPAF